MLKPAFFIILSTPPNNKRYRYGFRKKRVRLFKKNDNFCSPKHIFKPFHCHSARNCLVPGLMQQAGFGAGKVNVHTCKRSLWNSKIEKLEVPRRKTYDLSKRGD